MFNLLNKIFLWNKWLKFSFYEITRVREAFSCIKQALIVALFLGEDRSGMGESAAAKLE